MRSYLTSFGILVAYSKIRGNYDNLDPKRDTGTTSEIGPRLGRRSQGLLERIYYLFT